MIIRGPTALNSITLQITKNLALITLLNIASHNHYHVMN